MLRFQIEGVLRLEPVPEHVTFDTMLELTSGEYEVKESPVRDELLAYYERELTFLRQSGRRVRRAVPQDRRAAADRAGPLRGPPCGAPHRGFRFSGGARPSEDRRRVPGGFRSPAGRPVPHYVRPIPSMTVAEFNLDPEQGKLDHGRGGAARLDAFFEAGGRGPVQLSHVLPGHALAGDRFRSAVEDA